ncbi:hypothetical protein IJT10_03200 [bacterium]|nr:hypothetical protein [bacterium]
MLFDYIKRSSDDRGQVKDEFTPLSVGGVANSGFEDILHELAFHIFNLNRTNLNEHEVQVYCEKIPRVGCVVEDGFIGHSKMAKTNISDLVDSLRRVLLQGYDEDVYDIDILDKKGKVHLGKLVLSWNGDGRESYSNIILRFPYSVGKSGAECIEDWFRHRIIRDIWLFTEQCKSVREQYHELKDKPCFIFLGGEAIEACYKVNGFFDSFGADVIVQKSLPTELDSSLISENITGDYPTFETGTVHGLLYSRPDGAYIGVNKDKVRYPRFSYNLGLRSYGSQPYDPCGSFDLKVAKSDFEPGRVYSLGRVDRDSLDILYAKGSEYGFKRSEGRCVSAQGLPFININLEKCIGKYLYCGAVEGEITKIRLGISDRDEPSLQVEEIEPIGVCDLLHATLSC